MGKGFLGTAASRAADVTLVTELVMGLVLMLGAVMARKHWYRAHALCQSIVVGLNLAVIAVYMMPSLRLQVFVALPAGIGNVHYLLAAVHGAVGLVAELFAVYIILVAGTDYLPGPLRFVHYKPWMRSALALWWLALLLGCATYAWWYIVSP